MDLKIEIEALNQVKNDLVKCHTELDELPKVINDQISAVTTWKGTGKGEYIKLLEPLRTKSENCSIRIANSAALLSQALQKYLATESGLSSQNNQLPADDIF